MKKLIEKIIEKLEEIQIENTCSDCPHKEKCDEVQENISDETTDLCGATIKALAIEIVKQEAEKYNNGWIPCDGVHFPEENVYVRVTTWTETEKIGFRRDGKWFVYGSDGMAEATVFAWQPTQPYQPKGE